jgi:UV DNA damage repair endonuclease
MHPGPYNCLASPNPKVVAKTVRELDCHSEQMNMLGFEPSNYNKIIFMLVVLMAIKARHWHVS